MYCSEHGFRNRGRYDIISLLLTAAQESHGITQTELMYKSFTSWAQLHEYINLLVVNELLIHSGRGYVTTPRGGEFIRCYDEMKQIERGVWGGPQSVLGSEYTENNNDNNKDDGLDPFFKLRRKRSGKYINQELLYAKIREMDKEGKYNTYELADIMGVSRGTILSALDRRRKKSNKVPQQLQNIGQEEEGQQQLASRKD